MTHRKDGDHFPLTEALITHAIGAFFWELTSHHYRKKQMKKQVTPRQRKELARRKQMGVALIQKPLRYIKAVLGAKHRLARQAKQCAQKGDGTQVQLIARSL